MHAFKFIIENNIFRIDSFKIGLENGLIKNYASLCEYYDIKYIDAFLTNLQSINSEFNEEEKS